MQRKWPGALETREESVRLGTWNCLIRLIARDFEWARQLADEYWPSEPESQIIILQASVGFWRNHWSAAKFLEMMPQYPVRRIRELYFIGTATVYGSNLIHQMRVSPPKSLSLLPHQEAMIKLLDHDIYEERFELELLGDRFYGISTMKVPGDESFWFFRLQRPRRLPPNLGPVPIGREVLEESLKKDLGTRASNVGATPEL